MSLLLLLKPDAIELVPCEAAITVTEVQKRKEREGQTMRSNRLNLGIFHTKLSSGIACILLSRAAITTLNWLLWCPKLEGGQLVLDHD